MKSAARTATKIFLVISIVGFIGTIIAAILFKEQILGYLPDDLKAYSEYVIYGEIGAAAFGIVMALFSFLALALSRRGFLISTGIFSLLVNPTVAILLFCIAHYEAGYYEELE